ncbi:MAG: response regulator transcription factor [bacterium]
MAHDVAAILERVALTLTNRNAPLTAEESVEFGRALADLADRIEQAVTTLRHLVGQMDPLALHEGLNLTARELEMLTHLAQGRTNAEIAKQCWITQNTVKFHMKNLFKKLGVRDRGQAMMIARAMYSRLEHRDRKSLPSG